MPGKILVNGGIYIAVFLLPKAQTIAVGKLGQVPFRKGTYFYVGSAQRNLSARLARHNRREKPLRWHIDYISSKAEMLGAITIAAGREYECKIAKELGAIFEIAVPNFGASDCRCGGHLFYCANFF